MKGLGAGKGIGSPYWVGLRPTKARPQNSTEKEKGAYNISPTTKIFRPRKIRLTRIDMDINSSSPPLAPK